MAEAPFRISGWDRFLMGVAPGWGLRRLQARVAARTMARHYDAAGGGRRTSGWHKSGSDANAAAGSNIATLRNLSRDLVRNNGWARRGIQVIANNVVGYGITPSPAEDVPKARATQAAKLWKTWAKSVECDYDGRMPFTGIQRLAMRTIAESGEVLLVRKVSTDKGLALPLRVRVLEPDYIDATKHGMVVNGDGLIRYGIEFDKEGRRVAYWLYDQHPGASIVWPGVRMESRRVPASDVIHIYEVERPGLIRGVPWLCAVIAKLQDFDDYEDAVLLQKKIAACFAAFVRDLDGTAGGLGQPDADDDTLETLEPGMIAYLPPGKDVTFATPPNVADHGTFSTTNLRRIAAGLGVTYEDLTSDYSQVNFSSARMARLAHWANVDNWRWNMFVPQLCDGVWRWAMELAAARHGWRMIPEATWSAPPVPMLEPEKEGLAMQRLVRAGVKSQPQVIREQGEDPDQVLAEIVEWNKKLDEHGVVLDSDPRKTSATGQAQAEEPAGDPDDAQA